ncbi:MAG: potassium/hydrogen antiporter, partial [Kribbellaceae bacterium]|nr:potassium/hydrogen antiporter [Kribbellaceae bacterium]
FEDAQLAHALGFAALVIILIEGGLTTRWNEVRPVMPMGVVLATLGVAISVGVVACVAHFVLGLDWQISVLLGAVTSPTDAAAVFSVLRRVNVRPRLRGMLEAESGLNDAPTVLLVTLVSTDGLKEHGLPYFAGLVVYELVIGALFGFVIGWAAVGLLRKVALGSAGLYPLAIVSLCFVSYAGGTVLLHVSGFAAVYVTSLILGRAELPHRIATRSFVDGFAWLAQIGLFVMLGLLASPGRIRLNDVLLALVIGIAVTVVGRFAAVTLSVSWFRIPWREQTFVAWAGLRGAVPIVLATIPLAEKVPQADRVFDVVFVLVLLFTLLQGPSLPWLAKRLKVLDDNAAVEVDIDVAPLESLGADMLQVQIPSESRLAGVEIGELRLPPGVSVSLVIREHKAFVPERRTVLRAGDAVLVVAPSALREPTVRRLRAVSRAGRLAGWFGERGREQH